MKQSRFERMRSVLVLVLVQVVVVAVILAGCGNSHQFKGIPYDPPMAAPALDGLNPDGSAFELSALPEKVRLIFFGYTFCPDICPLALAELNVVYTKLGEQASDVAVVFVSVDPDRDTPEKLGTYVHAFNQHFYGVHIPADKLDAVKKGYGVFAEKHVVDAKESTAGYLVDHTAWTYAVDSSNQLRVVFSSDNTVDDIVADVDYLLGN